MGIDIKYRAEKIEVMDDFSLGGEELRNTLSQISHINQFLGGNTLTLNGVRKLLLKADTSKAITIADIGCGNGDMLRMLADYAEKNNMTFELIGIDANPFTIDHARILSTFRNNISYRCVDVFDMDFKTLSFDIILCTLTLHHFSDDKIINLMNILVKSSSLGIVINDLQRNKLAYRLFQMICFVFGFNKMTRDDGLISILKGFKKYELESYARKLHLKDYSIKWKWAFRYQWLISHI